MIYWLGHAEPDALHLGPERIDQTALRNVLRNMKRSSRPDRRPRLPERLPDRRVGRPRVVSQDVPQRRVQRADRHRGADARLVRQSRSGWACWSDSSRPGTSIGSILRGLRQSHGPLGLLYGAYCPPDLHVQAEDEPDAHGQIGQIEELTAPGAGLLGGSRAAGGRAAPVAAGATLTRSTPTCRWAPTVPSIAPSSTAATTTWPGSP